MKLHSLLGTDWELEGRIIRQKWEKVAKGCCQYSIRKEAFDILINTANVKHSKKLLQHLRVGGNKCDRQEGWNVREEHLNWQRLLIATGFKCVCCLQFCFYFSSVLLVDSPDQALPSSINVEREKGFLSNKVGFFFWLFVFFPIFWSHSGFSSASRQWSASKSWASSWSDLWVRDVCCYIFLKCSSWWKIFFICFCVLFFHLLLVLFFSCLA